MKNRHIITALILTACDSSQPPPQEVAGVLPQEEVAEPQHVASAQPDTVYVKCACLDFEDNTYYDECFSPPKECSDEEVLQCVVE